METVSMFQPKSNARNKRENKHYANDDEFVYVASDCGAAGAVGSPAAAVRLSPDKRNCVLIRQLTQIKLS